MKRALLPLALLLGAAPAAATPAFPGVIRDALSLEDAPSCRVCHSAAGGGSGTATKPFALSLLAAGLVPFNDASLQTALAQLETDATDSDEDGVGDIDELRAGTDPNAAASPDADAGPEPAPIQYGFGCAHAAPGSAGALAVALLALSALKRWRRAPCPRR